MARIDARVVSASENRHLSEKKNSSFTNNRRRIGSGAAPLQLPLAGQIAAIRVRRQTFVGLAPGPSLPFSLPTRRLLASSHCHLAEESENTSSFHSGSLWEPHQLIRIGQWNILQLNRQFAISQLILPIYLT